MRLGMFASSTAAPPVRAALIAFTIAHGRMLRPTPDTPTTFQRLKVCKLLVPGAACRRGAGGKGDEVLVDDEVQAVCRAIDEF